MIDAPTRAGRIEAALRAEFEPLHIDVFDESAMHAGHAGAAPGGETHFRVSMEASSFHGVGRVERSRAVHSVLADEFGSGLHALALKLRAPGE